MLVKDILDRALREGKFKDFLLGVGTYVVPSREGYATDRAAVMHSGIYKKYPEDPQIKELFENELKGFLKGDAYELMSCFDYVRIQMTSEANKTTPFELDKEVYEQVKQAIIQRAEELKQYRNYEFGGMLQDGAYQYINNINNALEENFGTKLF